MTLELSEKLVNYQKKHPGIRLYALVNGLQYERCFGEEINYILGVNNPLFRHYPDSKLAFAGPWLFDMEYAHQWQEKLSILEETYPAVSWLLTSLSLDKLTRHLVSYLNIQLPTKQTALLRFYDPRILHRISDIFSHEQLFAFTHDINKWVYQYNATYYSVSGAPL
ncbi:MULTISPECIES: DUF4123 domain-containing protein [Photorhabdus]|uniref:DUF4123 domain-containing protein n=4 Tax=Photorhabdus TaxID=29487 RepID=A0AAW6BLJ7_9GAMM|nr:MULTISPECIES: DUF4123 domain-containing protein [Photorhabdus]PQQ24258.1 DUF4123 domain-containing protein [Photorhabdus luminescens]MDB6372654.1 DUF4123 domain-containing protein [Photorhabdus bodei]NDK98426.1 DUF4123 domain-containing protein [Photorhabdus bodei]NDL02678.1 DUF4123 domain-containing protein [Photorhabdus bodei]NDL06840.1 DUF4123 domain-containing protein [Photorhabdus bodei]